MSVVNGANLFQLAPIANMLPTKERNHGVSHGLAEAGYDIRIKQDVWFYPDEYHAFNDSLVRPAFTVVDGRQTRGRFVLASAIEEFVMPNQLIGIVHDKSTWARQGLSVFNTVIEPGFQGGLTLELVYHGNTRLHIKAGSGIAQVVFHKLEKQASYNGKYQNQSSDPVPAIME